MIRSDEGRRIRFLRRRCGRIGRHHCGRDRHYRRQSSRVHPRHRPASSVIATVVRAHLPGNASNGGDAAHGSGTAVSQSARYAGRGERSRGNVGEHLVRGERIGGRGRRLVRNAGYTAEGRIGGRKRTPHLTTVEHEGIRENARRIERRCTKLSAISETGWSSRFEAVDRRFEAVDRRFDAIDRRFETIDRRFLWIVGFQMTTLIAVFGAIVAALGG